MWFYRPPALQTEQVSVIIPYNVLYKRLKSVFVDIYIQKNGKVCLNKKIETWDLTDMQLHNL